MVLQVIIGANAMFWTARPKPRATTSDQPRANPPSDLVLSFARRSKDIVSSFAPHEPESSFRPSVSMSDLEGEEMRVIRKKENVLPEDLKAGPTTLVLPDHVST